MTQRAHSPKTIEQLKSILLQEETVEFVAGGTDWMIALQARQQAPLCCVSLMDVEELQGIRVDKENAFLIIGAAEPLTSIAESPLVKQYAPALACAAASVGSTQIRNRGTLGGNLANASPAADTPVALAALDAEVRVYGVERDTFIPTLNVIAGISQNTLTNKEILREFRIPLKKSRSAFTKVGSRKDVSIARLNMAVSATVSGESLTAPRLFVGTLGMPFRATEAEKQLCQLNKENHTAFLDALSACVEERIPGRYSLPYKRSAIRGLGEDLLSLLLKEGVCSHD